MAEEGRTRILIIDDEEIVLDACRQMLEDGPHEVATATDGHEGLRAVQEFGPDLVFVDLKMPGISGFQVIEGIRALDPGIVSIVITGYATLTSAVEAMQKGAYDFIPKPFTPDEFRLVTRRGLDRRRLILEAAALRRERDMLRENFAAIVSHELKAPLGAVLQNLTALQFELGGHLSDEQRARLDRLVTRLQDLLKLIGTWLRALSGDLSSIRAEFRPVGIAEIVARAVDTVETLATRKDMRVVTETAAGLPQVSADGVTLTEALVNLLTNAIKFSPAGRQVRVSAEPRNGQVMISVTDQGVGIPPDELPHIFGDFYRGRTGTTGETGSGLGLAITRRIIEAHDGTIAVKSQPGEGTTVDILLPALAGSRGEPEQTRAGDSEHPRKVGAL